MTSVFQNSDVKPLTVGLTELCFPNMQPEQLQPWGWEWRSPWRRAQIYNLELPHNLCRSPVRDPRKSSAREKQSFAFHRYICFQRQRKRPVWIQSSQSGKQVTIALLSTLSPSKVKLASVQQQIFTNVTVEDTIFFLFPAQHKNAVFPGWDQAELQPNACQADKVDKVNMIWWHPNNSHGKQW